MCPGEVPRSHSEPHLKGSLRAEEWVATILSADPGPRAGRKPWQPLMAAAGCLLLPDGTLSPRTDGGQTLCPGPQLLAFSLPDPPGSDQGFLPTLGHSPVTLFGTSGRLKPLSTAHTLSLHGLSRVVALKRSVQLLWAALGSFQPPALLRLLFLTALKSSVPGNQGPGTQSGCEKCFPPPGE